MKLKFLNTNLIIVCLYGLINGIGTQFCGNSINFWLASNHINIEIIGLFSMVMLPQALKYFISIFIHQYSVPYLNSKYGNQTSWLILAKILIVISLLALSFLEPHKHIWIISGFSLVISLMAVIQYVLLNGSRISILSTSEQGIGNANYNLGYRIGIFFTGAGIIYLSIILKWNTIFILTAILYFILSTLIIKSFIEPNIKANSNWYNTNKSFFQNIVLEPIKHFDTTHNLIWIICIILFFQAADSMLMTMLNPFLLSKNYTPEQIASASKICGLIMVIIGSFIGGIITDRNSSIKNCLFSFSLIHATGYAMFYILNLVDNNIVYLYFVTGFVALTGGMATTAYLSFISKLCKGAHSSTLYALLSSVIGLTWTIFPSISGFIVSYSNWQTFFLVILTLGILSSVITFIAPASVYLLYSRE